MSDPDAYIALISSLPSSERLFIAKQAPLSRLRLDKRLSALTLEDRKRLDLVEQLMSWRSYNMDDGDLVAISRAKTAMGQLGSETLCAIIAERMDLRTIVAALRMRKNGRAAPTAPWGASRLTAHVVANWSDPTFKLDRRMSWLREAVGLLDKQDPLGLERHILGVTFRQLQRHAARHFFDFEAVVIYVLKWNIFDRWARSDARAATSRFEALAQDALGDFAELTLEGVE